MSIGPELLDALRVDTVRNADGFAALTRDRAPASDGGTTLYRLRELASARNASGRALSVFGNTSVGAMLFSAIADRFGTDVSVLDNHPLGLCVMAVLQGSFRFQGSRQDDAKVAGAGATLLCRLRPGAQAASSDGCERINLWLNAALLSRRLEDALDRPLSAPLAFLSEDRWPAGVGDSLNRLVRHVAVELADPYSLLAGGVGAASFEDLVIRTVLDGVPHNYSVMLDATAASGPPDAVRRAMAFMRGNLLQPMTATEIARASGCSARALAASFREHRGQTVMAALRDLRLDAARDAIARGDPALRMRDVAMRFGFSNLGRFSRQYRERFGGTTARGGGR